MCRWTVEPLSKNKWCKRPQRGEIVVLRRLLAPSADSVQWAPAGMKFHCYVAKCHGSMNYVFNQLCPAGFSGRKVYSQVLMKVQWLHYWRFFEFVSAPGFEYHASFRFWKQHGILINTWGHKPHMVAQVYLKCELKIPSQMRPSHNLNEITSTEHHSEGINAGNVAQLSLRERERAQAHRLHNKTPWELSLLERGLRNVVKWTPLLLPPKCSVQLRLSCH